MSRKTPPPAASMVLQGDLDLFSIQPQWEALRSRLTSHQGPLVLDLNGIGDIDLSGIQLLLALEQQASAQGIALSLAGVKQEWIDRFRPLGLARLLEDHS